MNYMIASISLRQSSQDPIDHQNQPSGSAVDHMQSGSSLYCRSPKLLYMKKSVKAVTNKNEAAYHAAQHLLKEREEGYIPYDMLITSIPLAEKMFPKRIGDELLRMLGHDFLWKRVAGEALLLYGMNRVAEDLKDRGPVEICRFRAPEQWVGAGTFLLEAFKANKKAEGYTLLLTLYLCSVNSDDFTGLLGDVEPGGAYLASIYLDEQNTRLFYDLAEERYDDIE